MRQPKLPEIDPLLLFWSRVRKPPSKDACWPWMGPRNHDDYGTVGGPLLKLFGEQMAHRLALASTKGLTAQQKALHTCDNPPCVRPSHLYAGSALDNARDAVTRGRLHRKLTVEKIRKLRRLRRKGYSWSKLAKVASASAWSVRNAVNGVTWRQLCPVES